MLDLEEIHLDNSNLLLSSKLIYKNALEAFNVKPRVVFLGGDHSISYSLTKAFYDYCNKEDKEPCLIVFDAHPDCMIPMDKDAPTHEEWLYELIEKGFPAKNILLVGVRNSDPKEIAFLKEKGVRVISVNQLLIDLEDTCDVIMEFSK